MPISQIKAFAAQIYAHTLEMTATVLTAVRDIDETTTVDGEITHYTDGGTIQCQIGPRTRRDASLFKTQIQEVQGEIIMLTRAEDIPRLGDADVVRTPNFDYSVRFAVNESEVQEIYGHYILEKLPARVQVV